MDDPRLKFLRGKQIAIQEGLCTHPAKDFAEYMNRVGQHQGLQVAVGQIETELRDEADRNK